MKVTKIFYTGLNLFKRYENSNDFYVDSLKCLNIFDTLMEKFDIKYTTVDNFQIVNSWSTTLISVNEYFIAIENCVDDSQKSTFRKFNESINKISCCNEYCLILLKNGSLWKFSFKNLEFKELQFLDVENSIPDDYITDIACSETFSVATTKRCDIYNIPSKLFTLKNNDKVKKICCGMEHAVLLTVNGDVYIWGTGTRGQLGMGDLNELTIPTLVEALSGIRIIDIDAGGWHTCCVSAFGDLYSWGWNLNGQLGLRIYETNSKTSKNPALYALPQIVDISYTEGDCVFVKSVVCGSRHTVIKTDSEEYFSTGWNQYGQCGHKVDTENTEIDNFKKINLDEVGSYMSCNNWTTIFY